MMSRQRQLHSTSTGSDKTQVRSKSTAVDETFEEVNEVQDFPKIDVTSEFDADMNMTNNNSNTANDNDTPMDYTFDKSKSGTPSPWAVFDAWGAGDEIHAPLDPNDEMKLSPESVKIPTSEDERQSATNETDILNAYDNLLKSRSTSS